MKFSFHHSCPEPFVKEARKYLFHPRGWKSKGFEVTENDYNPDTVIYLRSPVEMDRIYGKIKRLQGLSVTDSRAHPIIISIHAGNWRSPPKAFKGTLQQYRAYLINHEAGHALGYGHDRLGRRDAEGKCSLMSQQSKGTKKCTPNGFPNSFH